MRLAGKSKPGYRKKYIAELRQPPRVEPTAVECESLPFLRMLSGRDVARTVAREWYPA